ncbi:MAG: uracil-DNA glycosylase [Bryobacterales bacterium]
MADPLYEYLRFYSDLGFTDLYVPEGAAGFINLPGGTNAPAAAADRGRELAGSLAPQKQNPPGSLAAADPPVRPTTRPPAPPRETTPPRDMPPPSSYRPPQGPSGAAGSGARAAGSPLQILDNVQTDIGECTRCRLHEGRSKIVFGSGNPNAKLVFVGEGPGADEDAQGVPFVGRAGQLLTQMINNTATGEGIPISRDDVYICNVVKCRPPGNRTPEPDEMETCGQFLDRQLDAIRPKAICVLGATAARYLLSTRVGITKLRGNWQDWQGIPVMPTYHPSFLLRPYAQDKKREAWEDLKKVMHFVYDSE